MLLVIIITWKIQVGYCKILQDIPNRSHLYGCEGVASVRIYKKLNSLKHS